MGLILDGPRMPPRMLYLFVIAAVLAASPPVRAEEPSELRRKFLSGTPYDVKIEAPVAAKPEAPAPEPEPEPSGPLYSLQVGAFREFKKAAELRSELLENFTDIEIVETQSGGQSLFRVRVGHEPSRTGLGDLKEKLTEAGYASFTVNAD